MWRKSFYIQDSEVKSLPEKSQSGEKNAMCRAVISVFAKILRDSV